MKTNMENASVMDPGSLNASQNPLYLLSASLQYLLAYTKALAKECKPPEEEEGPITVISFSPTHEPFIDFIDRIDLMKNVALSEVAQEYNSGMFMCYLGNERIADDDRRLLIGPAIMFNCDESGAFIPVSALGFKRTKEFYKRGEETLEVGRVKVPAIRVELVGENVTCVQKKET